MANYVLEITTDLREPLKRTPVTGQLIQLNDRANTFQITVLDDSEPVTLNQVEAYFIRGDSATVRLVDENCTISGNVATVTLSNQCYAVPGPFVLTVNDISEDTTKCIGRFDGVVARTSTDAVVDPGTIIPSVNALINEIEDAIAEIPEDYSQLSQDVVEIKAAYENMPIEAGSATGAVQVRPYTDGDDTQYITQAVGMGSFAEGGNTLANGMFAHAEGFHTVAQGRGSHCEGYGRVDFQFRIIITTSGTAMSTLFRYENVDANKPLTSSGVDCYLLIDDEQNTVAGIPGRKIQSVDTSNHTLVLEQGLGTVLENASAIVTKCGAAGNGSHAEGYNCYAWGNGSHAEGNNTLAINNGSHAEGVSTQAKGQGSHAEGANTIASTTYAHAEGYNTTASGSSCHAEGSNTVASGFNSHAEGSYTIARANQHVEGTCNIEDTEGNYLHIVGNGTTVNNRSNAYTLDKQGNGTYAGNVTANGGSLILHGANGDVTLTAEILARIIADYSN